MLLISLNNLFAQRKSFSFEAADNDYATKTLRLKEVIIQDLLARGFAPGSVTGTTIHEVRIQGVRLDESYATQYEHFFNIEVNIRYRDEYEDSIELTQTGYSISYRMPKSEYIRLVRDVIDRDNFTDIKERLDELQTFISGASTITDTRITDVLDEINSLNQINGQMEQVIDEVKRISERNAASSDPEVRRNIRLLENRLNDVAGFLEEISSQNAAIEENLKDAIKNSEKTILAYLARTRGDVISYIWGMYGLQILLFTVLLISILWVLYYYRSFNEDHLDNAPLFFEKIGSKPPLYYVNPVKAREFAESYYMVMGNNEKNQVNIADNELLNKELAGYWRGDSFVIEQVDNIFLRRVGFPIREEGKNPTLTAVEKEKGSFTICKHNNPLFILKLLRKANKGKAIKFKKHTFVFKRLDFKFRHKINH
jgi:hypothetical protein